MNERKQRRPPDPPGHSWVQPFCCTILTPPPRLSYVQLITGFVSASFIQPLCPCVWESLSSNPSPAASFAPFFHPVFPWKGAYVRPGVQPDNITTSHWAEIKLWVTDNLSHSASVGWRRLSDSVFDSSSSCLSICLSDWEPPQLSISALSLLFPFAFWPHICCQSPLLNLYTSSVAVFSICCLLFNPVFFLCVVPLLFNTSYLLRLKLILLSHQADRPAEWHN